MRFKVALELDLPSQQIFDKPGTLSRIFGAKATATGSERVVGSALAVIDCFVRAYQSIGINNIIALDVDGKSIYLDNAMVADDLQLLSASLQANKRILSQPFEYIHLVLELPAAGIHYVIDTKVRGEVQMGHEEVYIVVAGKMDALNPGARETAVTYRNRIRQLLSTPGMLERFKVQFRDRVKDLLQRLKTATNAHDGKLDFLELGVVRPSRKSVHALISQPFGRQWLSFRNEGLAGSNAAYYHDPYSYYYYNPFDTFANLVVIDALLDGTAREVPIDMVVYNHDGSTFGIADHVESYRRKVIDVPAIASEQAAASLDAGQLLSDPAFQAALGEYGRTVGDTTL